MSTYAFKIFENMAKARESTPMQPRSKNDKEYFAQDWFNDRLQDIGVDFSQQGRNSYPDFIVGAGDNREGYEIKSLRFSKGRPARRDIDFNSTIPSGEKEGSPVFLVFFLYEGAGESPRSVHTISLVHADLINADHAVADDHVNVAIHGFGSYGDGFIRNRKMYVFPHPVTIDPSGLGRARLIVPEGWGTPTPNVQKVGRVTRTQAAKLLEGYRIHLYGRTEPEIHRDANPEAGEVKQFAIYEWNG
jgi:hypothetical protein